MGCMLAMEFYSTMKVPEEGNFRNKENYKRSIKIESWP